MKKLLVFNLYILFTLLFLSMISPDFINLNFIKSVKYIYIISISLLIIIYSYKNSIRIKFDLLAQSVFIMLLIVLIPGTLFSVEMDISLFRGILALMTFIIIFGSVWILGSEEILEQLYKFFLIVAIATILFTDILLLTGDTRAFLMGNLKSFFQNANGFGALIGLFLLPALLLKIFKNSGTKKSYIYIFLFINLLILFWFARTRSGLLSFAVFGLLILYYKYFRWHKKRIKYFVLLLFSLSIFGMIAIDNAKIQSYLKEYFVKHEYVANRTGGMMINSREQLWSDRIQGIEKRPSIGWGYGVNSMDYDKAYSAKHEHGSTEKGNSALAILEEFGLFFGLLLIFIIGFIIFRLFLKMKRKHINNINLYLITNSVLFVSLIHVNFESWLLYFGNPNAFFFWFLLVAIISSRKEKPSNKLIKVQA